MTRRVVTVPVSERASVAGRLMWECDCGVVPVVDDDGRVVGMITDRDIYMAAVLQDCAPSGLACAPEDRVSSAETLMRSHQIRRIPVLDRDRRPVGILSLADVARASEGDKGRKKEVRPDEVIATLADICTPRAAPAVGAHA